MQESFLGGKVIVAVGDLTEETTDAIVNAANSTLLGGGGVDGAIHRKGGEQILKECREIRRTAYPNGLPTGKAVITSGGNLPARFVIHTVGPVYGMNQGNDSRIACRLLHELSAFSRCKRSENDLISFDLDGRVSFSEASGGRHFFAGDKRFSRNR